MQTSLARYLAAATLARVADAGAGVGIVLLARDTPGLVRPSLIGALLVTGMTAPHLLGPLLARRLDRARDGRRFIAVTCAVYGACLMATTLALGHVPVVLVAGPTVVAGICGPILTGGLSSRLAALVTPDERAQGRALGFDSLSYGISGTVGPALVAGLVAVTDARVAMVTLSVSSGLAGMLVRTLPEGGDPVPADQVLPLRRTLTLIARSGPLRRILYATTATALPAGAIAVVTVAYGDDLRVRPDTAGLLTAAFGLGYLLGSLVVTARPLLGEPERLVVVFTGLIGSVYVLAAAATGFPLAFAAFTLAGVVSAPLFTATLAARGRYSPPQARAQVFVTMAALKVGAASAGAAAAGAAIGWGARPLLLTGAVLIVASAGAMLLDRHCLGDRSRSPLPPAASSRGGSGRGSRPEEGERLPGREVGRFSGRKGDPSARRADRETGPGASSKN